jgi:hypothetical protein
VVITEIFEVDVKRVGKIGATENVQRGEFPRKSKLRQE